MPVDLFSLVQDGKRSVSFMSQALGLMADLDLGTEHLRWMGDARFGMRFFHFHLTSHQKCVFPLIILPPCVLLHRMRLLLAYLLRSVQ